MSSSGSSATTSRSNSPVGGYIRAADEEVGRFKTADQRDVPDENAAYFPKSTNDRGPNRFPNSHSQDLSNNFNQKMRFQPRYDREYPEPDINKKVEEIFSSIQVKNLSRNVTEAHLKEIFGEFGNILCMDYPVELKAQKNTNAVIHRGYAFIDFSSKEIHDKCIEEMDGGYIDGVKLEVVTSNGTRSAMNLGDREHYLRTNFISMTNIQDFFLPNFEYSKKSKILKQERFRENRDRFNRDRGDYRRERNSEVYYPGRGRPGAYGGRFPRDDVYRPGRPFGQMRGSKYFDDRDRYGRLSPEPRYSDYRRSPSPGPIPNSGRRFGGDLGRSRERFSRSPSPYTRLAMMKKRNQRFSRSRSSTRSISPGYRKIKKEALRHSLSRSSRSPIPRRTGGRRRSPSYSPIDRRGRGRSPPRRGADRMAGRRRLGSSIDSFSSDSRSSSPGLMKRRNSPPRSALRGGGGRYRSKSRSFSPPRRQQKPPMRRGRSSSFSPKRRGGRPNRKSSSRSMSPIRRRRRLSNSPGFLKFKMARDKEQNRRSYSRSISPKRRRSPMRGNRFRR